MSERWRNFDLEEFACKCGCEGNEIDFAYVDKLQWMRTQAGFALVVNSGYRCPKHNNEVSSTGFDGPHTTGRAADLRVDRERAYRVLELALKVGMTGVGVAQKGLTHTRFIHLDDLQAELGRPRPTVWSY